VVADGREIRATHGQAVTNILREFPFFLSYQDGSGAGSVSDEPWISRGGYPSSSTVPSNITSLVRTGIVLLPIDLLRMKARPYEIPDSAG
jgi:hypothetical protein